jgi:two-component system response regulator RpaA
VPDTILVIDDDLDICEIVKVNLEGAGYNVVVATDGATGLARAMEIQPNLIVLDVLMPEMDGWQVLERLTRDARTAGQPVVMLTCKGDDHDILRGLDRGAVEYVTKPFYPENLVASIKILLNVFDSSTRESRRQQLIARRQRQIDNAAAPSL